MKRLSRIIPIIMTTVFFLTGIPAAETFAAEEDAAFISAEEQITPEQQGQNTPDAEPAQEIAEQSGEESNGELQLPADPAAEEPAVEEPTDEAVAAEDITEEIPLETACAEPLLGEEEQEPSGDGNPDEGPGEGGKDTPDPKNGGDDPSGEKDDKPQAGKTVLSVTNNTRMFNVVDAYIETKDDGTMYLVIALSGTGYDYLFVGTYEEAVQTGYSPSKWIKYFTDGEGRKAFSIKIDKDSSYFPVISISNSYLKKYEQGKGKESLARAFFARQVELDQKNKTLTTGDYEMTLPLTVKNNTKKISAESASLSYVGGPNNNEYAADLVVKMGNSDFDRAFIGSKKDAEEAEKTIKIGKDRILTLPVKWTATFGDPDSLVSLVGKEFTVSLREAEKKTWVEYSFLVKEKAGTLLIEVKEKGKSSGTDDIVIPGQKSSKEKQKEQKQNQTSGNVGGSTGAVDNSTGLKDGVYKPDKFSFSGGSGRIAVTCSSVEVKDGKAYATIEFRNLRSGVAEFSYVKANGQTYNCTQQGGVSVVTIPVELNANTHILGMTTKMSAAHEIAYSIFVYIKGADEKKADDLTENKDFDEEAPQIAGLEVTGEETVEEAKYFKIFNYSDGIRLLEIDMRTTGDKTKKTEEKKETAEEEAETTIIDEETGEEIVVKADKQAAQAELYKGNIIKYLLVPEGVEIPAGLDKETIVLQLPVKSVYAGSEAIRKMMTELGVGNEVTCMEKEDGSVQEAGAFGDLKLRTLVKEKCDVVMIPGEILEKEEGRETFETQAEDLANLSITLIADRSAAEKTKKAKAEWVKVYGMLFGCEQAAQEAFSAVD